MNYQIISDSDFNIIFELDSRVQEVVDKFKKVKEYESFLSQLRKDMNLLRRKQIAPDPLHDAFFEVIFPEYQELSNEYIKLLDSWNRDMNSILVKYNYIQLSLFLKQNPLPGASGKQPNHKYASRTKVIANNIGIQVLRQLYVGDPVFINYYPEKWLKKVYLKIYNLKDGEKVNFNEFAI